jgi:hypothetical protein
MHVWGQFIYFLLTLLELKADEAHTGECRELAQRVQAERPKSVPVGISIPTPRNTHKESLIAKAISPLSNPLGFSLEVWTVRSRQVEAIEASRLALQRTLKIEMDVLRNVRQQRD